MNESTVINHDYCALNEYCQNRIPTEVTSISFIYLKSKRIDVGKKPFSVVVRIPVLIYDNGRSLYRVPCN